MRPIREPSRLFSMTEHAKTKTNTKRSAKKPDSRLGGELRRRRIANRLSVRGLATLLGFSASFISQLENGQTSPSIASLERIAGTLGVCLRDLFPESDSPTTALVRLKNRPMILSGWSRARIEALTGPPTQVPLDAMMVHLQPGGSSGSRLHFAPSDRFAFIWSGTVILNVADTEYQLKQGDAMTLPKGELHRWTNRSRRPVRILIVSLRTA